MQATIDRALTLAGSWVESRPPGESWELCSSVRNTHSEQVSSLRFSNFKPQITNSGETWKGIAAPKLLAV